MRGGSGHTGRTEWCGGMWAWQDAAQVYKDVLLDVTSLGPHCLPLCCSPWTLGPDTEKQTARVPHAE